MKEKHFLKNEKNHDFEHIFKVFFGNFVVQMSSEKQILAKSRQKTCNNCILKSFLASYRYRMTMIVIFTKSTGVN